MKSDDSSVISAFLLAEAIHKSDSERLLCRSYSIRHLLDYFDSSDFSPHILLLPEQLYHDHPTIIMREREKDRTSIRRDIIKGQVITW